jgi:branched-chain amino acid aminotransferase
MSVFFPDGIPDPYFVWRNGELVPWQQATIHASAFGAAGHITIFEGIKAYRNPDTGRVAIFRLPEHLKRLADSMTVTRMPHRFSAAEWTAGTLALLRANGTRDDTYIRPVAGYTGADHISFAQTLGQPPECIIWNRPFLSTLPDGGGLHVGSSSWARFPDNVIAARVKSMSNYINGRYATTEALVNGYDDVLQADNAGHIAEMSGAAVFVRRKGEVATPPVTGNLLESITRDTLLVLLRQVVGVPVVERPIDRSEVYVADEVFCCGTAAEVRPVVSLDRIAIAGGEVGALTRRVQALYHAVVRGAEPRYGHWLTPVHEAG